MLTGNALQLLARGLVNGEARRSNRKRKKNKGKNEASQQEVFARCAGQVPGCEAEIRRACANGPACIARALPCCQALTTCELTTFFTCTDEAFSSL